MSRQKRSWYDSQVLALAKSQNVHDPEQAIVSLCAALIDEAGFNEPPFSTEILASFRGVVSLKRIPIKGAGRLIPSNNEFEIQVNSDHSLEKQNFSIGHEICHTFFSEFGAPQTKTDLEVGTFNVRLEEEYLCDVGASALLFDSRWFRPLAIKLGVSSNAIFELSRQFGGSLEAAARSLCDLNLCPCAVIFWEKSLKPSQNHLLYQGVFPGLEDVKDAIPKLRVRLSWHSPSFAKVHHFPKHKSALESGLVYSCQMSQIATSGYEVVNSTCDQLWFDNVYVPYKKEGNICPRVMTVVTLTANPETSA